ncbi:MAG: hypothetical protein IT458_00945 [Planctomycetes bacterium]|nr:hypothetical protein [Planctomycetota bacterium]
MPEHPEPVVAHVARTAFEANIVLGVLEEAGIKAWVEEPMRQDEFAVAQRLMNLEGVSVWVGAPDLPMAQKAILEARSAGAQLDGGD